jgi:hypothetical protein
MNGGKDVLFSLIVPTLNRREAVENLLPSIDARTLPPNEPDIDSLSQHRPSRVDKPARHAGTVAIVGFVANPSGD